MTHFWISSKNSITRVCKTCGTRESRSNSPNRAGHAWGKAPACEAVIADRNAETCFWLDCPKHGMVHTKGECRKA